MRKASLFNIHTKLQCSKTISLFNFFHVLFNIHTKLQCSKTVVACVRCCRGLISIRNYNALKQFRTLSDVFPGLISIRNYNALKRQSERDGNGVQFNIHTKLQCSKTVCKMCRNCRRFNIHTKLQCSKTLLPE